MTEIRSVYKETVWWVVADTKTEKKRKIARKAARVFVMDHQYVPFATRATPFNIFSINTNTYFQPSMLNERGNGQMATKIRSKPLKLATTVNPD